MYQRDWLGIPFSDVGGVSSRKLADAAFYRSFYEEFFRRHRSWSELGDEWLACKSAVARSLLNEARSGGASTVLSLGCGLGWVESCLAEWDPSLRVDVTELTDEPLRWVREKLPAASIHIGDFRESLPAASRYDLIFAHAMDYGMVRDDLIALLVAARERLKPGGSFILISATLDQSSLARRLLRMARAAYVRAFGARLAGWQLWGWYRSRSEYREIFDRAGLTILREGSIEGAAFHGQPMYQIVASAR